ncbi:MAG: hypothetical protein IRZ05_11080 [Micromonosporaceae bacterium]|nr:hypothetical protein [Micromonosporaceae bacterium]
MHPFHEPLARTGSTAAARRGSRRPPHPADDPYASAEPDDDERPFDGADEIFGRRG